MKKRNVIILIILLVIGFASVSTTLILNGTIGIGANLEDFDVVFVEALLNGEESSNVLISENKKTITFASDKLSIVGDTARLDYKVKNTSTQYDADVTINCTNVTSEYVTLTGNFDNNEFPLENPLNIKAQEVKSGFIDVKLIKAYVDGDASLSIKCEIEVNASSREKYAYSLNFDSNGGSKIDDKSIALNESYGDLPIPEKEGHTFLGWFSEDGVKVDENTLLETKGNKNLHAEWEGIAYPVGIVTNENGTSEKVNIDVVYGKTATVKITPNNNYYISNIECSDGYSVEDYNSKIPQYGEQTITIKNDQTTKEGTCTFTFEQGIYEYNYTGSEQEFIVPLDGNYKFEVYGAGGNNTTNGGSNTSTSGSKASGNINLKKQDLLYVYLGEREGPFNGGGSGGITLNSVSTSTHGSGASDIRLIKASDESWYDTSHDSWNNDESLLSRIITAGGGGGAKVGSGRNFNGSTPLNTYLNSSYLVYITYPRDGESSNGTLGLGSSEVTGTSKLTDTGDIGNGASGGGGGGWYGGSTSAASHNYTYAQFVNFMKQDSTGKTGGIVGRNGNRLAGTEVHCFSGTSYINNDYVFNGYTYHFTDTNVVLQQRNGNGYAKITLISID